MTLELRNIQLDCPPTSFVSSVAFWAGALGASPVESDGGRYVHIHGARSPVEVHLQRLDAGRSRIHLDLAADDIDAEVARLEHLGARVVDRTVPGIVVVEDPVGLVACVVAGSAPAVPLSDARGPGVRFNALIVDVLADQTDAAAAFWPAALEAASTDTAVWHGEWWTMLHGVRVAGGELPVGLQRVGPDARVPPPRFHLDVATEDLAGAAAALVTLGARPISTEDGCIVLADPSDHLLCVVAPREGGGAS